MNSKYEIALYGGGLLRLELRDVSLFDLDDADRRLLSQLIDTLHALHADHQNEVRTTSTGDTAKGVGDAARPVA